MVSRCPKCDRPLPDAASRELPFDPSVTQTRSTCPVCDEPDEGRTATYHGTASIESMQVAHFRLLKRLGQGGFGEVWLASDDHLGREVALKLPRAAGTDSENLLFEARTAARLQHPNIVSVFEVGEETGQVYIASELIDGLTLRDFLTAGRPSIVRCVQLLLPVARALHFAHQHGVVHRDIKPANILLDKAGEPYIADFGIAKTAAFDPLQPPEGQVVGTARYMSPEQAGGRTQATDARSDIYALGVTLFEMLTGETPFRGNNSAVLFQKVSDDPPSPRTFDIRIPRDLETICLKCLERDPDKRFATAQDLADELVRFSSGEPIRSRPISRVERTWRWCRKRPAISGLLASTILSLAAGLIGVSTFWRKAEANASAARLSLYHSWLNLAANHLDNGDILGVRDILSRIAADPEMSRFRGFAWGYFDTVLRPLHSVANAGGAVEAVALSRDGGLSAAIGEGGEVRVWDSRTNDLIRTLAGDPEQPFQSVEFSPTDARLATGGKDGFVRLWEPLAGERMVREMRHGPRIRRVRFSPDGRRVLSVGNKGAVRLWEAATGNKLAEIPTGQQAVPSDARFSADGGTLFVATEAGQVRVWDVEAAVGQGTGEVPVPIRQFTLRPNLRCLAVSRDGTLIAAGDFNGVLTTRSLSTDEVLSGQMAWGRMDALEFVAGTHIVAVAANDGQMHFYDIDSRQEQQVHDTHGLTVGTLAASADGRGLVLGSGDGSVTILRPEGLDVPEVLWYGEQPDPEEEDRTDSPPVRSLQCLPDGHRVVAAYDSAEMRVWDLKTGRWTPLPGDPERTGRLLVLQPGGGLLATVWNKPVVTLWNAETLQIERELPTQPTGAVAIGFSPSGRLFGCAGRGGPLVLYDAGDWSKSVREIAAGPSEVAAIALAADDRTVAVARVARTVELVDLASGTTRQVIPLDEVPTALAYCPDGTLAIATGAGDLLFWDPARGQTRAKIKGHTGRIHGLAVLPHSTTLVSAGRDFQLKLWDIPSGELIAPLRGHFRQVFSVATEADGQTIVSGGLIGEIRVWRAKPASSRFGGPE
jgi:serine/threonine protein kinase